MLLGQIVFVNEKGWWPCRTVGRNRLENSRELVCMVTSRGLKPILAVPWRVTYPQKDPMLLKKLLGVVTVSRSCDTSHSPTSPPTPLIRVFGSFAA